MQTILRLKDFLDITSLEDSIKSKVNAVENMLEEDREAVRGLAESLYSFGYGRGDVAEIFSPPRIASQAQFLGLRQRFSIHLGTRKPNGGRGDLSVDKDIQLAK